uniref:Uncharacterized protein n=1 Tax=Molossus molossus TaxID=27622 RepID=A0A7J8DPU7_MOLMO|nr:hypothetical protein HJG59_009219 [Molossus molossus]
MCLAASLELKGREPTVSRLTEDQQSCLLSQEACVSFSRRFRKASLATLLLQEIPLKGVASAVGRIFQRKGGVRTEQPDLCRDRSRVQGLFVCIPEARGLQKPSCSDAVIVLPHFHCSLSAS